MTSKAEIHLEGKNAGIIALGVVAKDKKEIQVMHVDLNFHNHDMIQEIQDKNDLWVLYKPNLNLVKEIQYVGSELPPEYFFCGVF